MKFDLNKEFSFAQLGEFCRKRFCGAVQRIKKIDSSSIKNINLNGKKIGRAHV